MSNSVPEGWALREAETLYTRLRVPRVYDRNQVSPAGKYPVIDQSESGCIGYLNSNPEFSCDEYSPLTTFANHTCAVRQMTKPFGVIQNVFPLKAQSDVSQTFLFQILHGAIPQDGYKGHYPQLRETQFLTPPLPEQQKIAAILSSVDAVIEKTRAQIGKLKDLKTGMMQELLTKGIGHTEFKDSPVGRIPEGWAVSPLDHVVKGIIDCEHKTAPYVESSEYLVVRTTNVRHGQLIHEDMKFTTRSGFCEWTKRATPSAGDVLFTREAPAGESCMVPDGVKVCMGQRMVLLRPDTDKIHPFFFSLFLTSETANLAIYELSIGTTVTRINIEDIRRIPCVVPPVEEQKAIYSKIQSIQSLITSKEEKLRSHSNVKKALMEDLLTGKVRVKADQKESAAA